MDAREAFRFGFMQRMLELGYATPAAMNAAIKTAAEKRATPLNVVSSLLRAVGNVGSTALGWAIPVGLAAPPILGYMGGQLAARTLDADEFDTDEAKRQELIDEYRSQADRARRGSLVRKLQQANALPGGRLYL